MKLGGVKKASEQKSENEPIKKYKKVVKTSTDSNRGLSVLLACMGVVIVGLVVAIVVVAVNRNSGSGESGGDESEDGEVTYASPIYESYDKLSEEFSIALGEMDQATTTTEDILELYQTYVDRATDELVKAMLMVDYYLVMMAGDSEGVRKTEVIDGLVATDGIVGSVKSASAVAVAATYYGDEELKTRYQALADVRAFGENGGDENNESEETAE